MSSNYYARINYCIHCGRYDRVHLGKSSFGWKFLIKWNPEHYKNFEEFCEFIEDKTIERGDGGEIVEGNWLYRLITNKQDNKYKSHTEVDGLNDIMVIDGFEFKEGKFI